MTHRRLIWYRAYYHDLRPGLMLLQTWTGGKCKWGLRLYKSLVITDSDPVRLLHLWTRILPELNILDPVHSYRQYDHFRRRVADGHTLWAASRLVVM